jgi:hypothetical protein
MSQELSSRQIASDEAARTTPPALVKKRKG